ncbi:MAG TPA: insulinase family protein [Longimicrobiales bacterium]|nr:insulinase family protein [Longimicrobiales bacterium]
MLKRALFFLALLPSAIMAQEQRLPIDPAVTVGTLPNGLRYYIRENRMPEQRAELRLVVNAGSILEEESQQGLAHFAEHMAFNGTRNFAKHELVSYLESIGMRFGADLNAYTGFDETVYMLQIPTDSAAPLVRAVQILEDWAHGVTFDPEELEKERGVVVEEWRLGQGAGERMRKQYFPVLFQNSQYAARLPIGKLEVLQTFRPEELTRFYRDWYRPDLMAVIAIGDFDRAVVERLIREHFGRIPAAAAPRARRLFDVPDHAETLVAIATDPEATNTIVEVDWKLPPRPQGTLAAYRAAILSQLYSSMLNQRFGEITQKPNAPFIGAGADYGSLIRTKAAYFLGAAVEEGGVERGLEAILTEGERVARHGFTATELAREKTNTLRAFERAYAEREKSESDSYAEEYVRAFLQGESIPGIAYEYELVQQLLPTITLTEVNALARTWMTDHSRVVIVTAPQRADLRLPTPDQLVAVFDRVAHKEIAPYQDIVADEPLLPALPAPGRVTARSRVAAADATLLELSNGVQVYLKPTTLKDDQVLLGAYSPGGLSLVSDADYASGVFAGQLINISGLGGMDAIQLQKALTGKVADVSAGAGETSEGVSGTASPRDLETMLQLVYLHFTAPRSDSAAYESFMERIRASLANRSASPEAAFSDTFALTFWQNHPRAQPQTVAWVDRIDRNASYRIYRDRFADGSDFSFVIVGNFHADSIVPLVEQYLGSLPATGRVERPRDTGMRPVRGVIEKTVRRGVEPKSQTRITFSGPFEYIPENRVTIALLVDILDMKLRDVLREDLGGTYGVGISQSTQYFPEGRYLLSINFGAAPERLEELTKTVYDELEKMKANGPDADALAKVKEQARRSHETSLQRNEYWLSVLLREAEIGEGAAVALNYPERVHAVTAAQIQAAAARYLDMRNYVRVSLMPER